MRTWGQMRFELAKQFPQIEQDLLTSFLQGAYNHILDQRAWSGLNYAATIQTTGQYITGTVTLTNGANTVTGSGTTFTSGMTGRRFKASGRNEWYTFTYVSSTSGTLDRNYEGDTISGASYAIYQPIYQLDVTLKYLQIAANPSGKDVLQQVDPEKIVEYETTAATIGTPGCFAVYPPTDEATYPIYQRIQLYPAPEDSVGLLVRGQLSPVFFDGSNTGSYPLSFVSTDAILAWARYRCAQIAKDVNTAQAALGEYNTFVNDMHLVENQRIGPQRMEMASPFTSHRRQRWMR